MNINLNFIDIELKEQYKVTKKEVENYQKDKKLQVDGMAGIETHTSLISYK